LLINKDCNKKNIFFLYSNQRSSALQLAEQNLLGGNCSLPVREGRTFLWRIATSPPSYFFGTIHVPYTRVWGSVADNAKQAFQHSDKVKMA
jgi:uncharacterized protein YbaP (TraB family)